jgi:hypothetical protein
MHAKCFGCSVACWPVQVLSCLPLHSFAPEKMPHEVTEALGVDALPAEPTGVLLTGANGFLGRFLLLELLRRVSTRCAWRFSLHPCQIFLKGASRQLILLASMAHHQPTTSKGAYNDSSRLLFSSMCFHRVWSNEISSCRCAWRHMHACGRREGGRVVAIVRGQSDEAAWSRLRACFDSGDAGLLETFTRLSQDRLTVYAGAAS